MPCCAVLETWWVVTERLLTAREVGELVGLSTESVLRRWRAGEIPGFRLASNVLRFDQAEVDAWLRSCRVGAPAASGQWGETVTQEGTAGAA